MATDQTTLGLSGRIAAAFQSSRMTPLLALVAAMFPDPGLPTLLKLYQHAIDRRYRFYSYGDAMLILK